MLLYGNACKKKKEKKNEIDAALPKEEKLYRKTLKLRQMFLADLQKCHKNMKIKETFNEINKQLLKSLTKYFHLDILEPPLDSHYVPMNTATKYNTKQNSKYNGERLIGEFSYKIYFA